MPAGTELQQKSHQYIVSVPWCAVHVITMYVMQSPTAQELSIKTETKQGDYEPRVGNYYNVCVKS